MISGSKGYTFHAGIRKHDFETRKTREKKPELGGFSVYDPACS